MAHEPIPPEKNADAFLRRAADDLDAIQKELLAYYPKRGYPPETVAPADQDKLEKLFADYPKVMPLLEQAANCPDNDPQLDCSLPTTRFLELYFKRPEKRRLINRVMLTRSAWLLSKGRADDALATQLLTLRLTRQWRREPLMIGYLVTVACEVGAMEGANRVLQAGPVSRPSRQALDTELVLHDTMDGYNWALRSERAYSLSCDAGTSLHRVLADAGLRAMMRCCASSISTIGTWKRVRSPTPKWFPSLMRRPVRAPVY